MSSKKTFPNDFLNQPVHFSLRFDAPRPAHENMACDETVLHSTIQYCTIPIPNTANTGSSTASFSIILRNYGWTPAAVSFGYHETIHSRINLHAIKKDGLDIVRRFSGGRSVLHDQELTFAIVFPLNILQNPTHTGAFTFCSELFMHMFNSFGITTHMITRPHRPATHDCFNTASQFELVDTQGRKVVGSAQRITEGVVLHHAAIPFKQSSFSLSDYLPVPKYCINNDFIDKYSDKTFTEMQQLLRTVLFTILPSAAEEQSPAPTADLLQQYTNESFLFRK